MLKRWGRGLLVLASISCMFVLGIMMGARLYAPNTADLLDMLGFLGDLGAGLLYLIGHGLGLGQVLMMGRDLNDMSAVIAVMILIIAIGYAVDGVVFKSMERHLQRQWGLTSST